LRGAGRGPVLRVHPNNEGVQNAVGRGEATAGRFSFYGNIVFDSNHLIRVNNDSVFLDIHV